MTADEDREQMARLTALAALPDEQIDFSDIPKTSEEFWRDAVHGPWTPREPHTVTLRIDAEVAEWLETAAKTQSYLINLLLKREAQRQKRDLKSAHVQQGGECIQGDTTFVKSRSR